MSAVTVGDMLQRVKEFERRLEAYYAGMRDTTASDGVRLLTHYLARRRCHLRDALASYSPQQLAHIRRVQLKYDDTDFSLQHSFEAAELPAAAGGTELLDVAIPLVETLIRFYRWMAGQPLGHEAGGLFESLLHIEERHVIELKKIRAMDYF